jgi:general stress protein 26
MAKDKGKNGKNAGDGPARKLRKIMKGARVAMLTTVAPDGTLRSRPMEAVKAPFDGDLWFFTRASAPKTGEIRDNDHVNVSFADPEGDRYLSLSGRASVVRDDAKIQELWSGKMKAWFAGGRRDPDLALLRVHLERAEYWDAKAGGMVEMAGGFGPAVEGKDDRRNEPGAPSTGSGAQG